MLVREVAEKPAAHKRGNLLQPGKSVNRQCRPEGRRSEDVSKQGFSASY
jgi:hypothetical protein